MAYRLMLRQSRAMFGERRVDQAFLDTYIECALTGNFRNHSSGGIRYRSSSDRSIPCLLYIAESAAMRDGSVTP